MKAKSEGLLAVHEENIPHDIPLYRFRRRTFNALNKNYKRTKLSKLEF